MRSVDARTLPVPSSLDPLVRRVDGLDQAPGQASWSPLETGLHRASRMNSLLFAFLLLSLCVWILSLPLFPSQDGASHKYYAWVVQHILSGDSWITKTYAIRRPIPPYASQSMVLVALARTMSLDMADKIFACLVVVSTALGSAPLLHASRPRRPVDFALYFSAFAELEPPEGLHELLARRWTDASDLRLLASCFRWQAVVLGTVRGPRNRRRFHSPAPAADGPGAMLL